MKFSSDAIGSSAGKIWNSLNEKGEQSVKELIENTELKKDDVLLGLGWLFKEGQLISKKVGRTLKIFLNK